MCNVGIKTGFCHKVWRRLKPLEKLDETKFFNDFYNPSGPQVVKDHGYLHSINGRLNGTSPAGDFNEPMGFGIGIPIKEFLMRTDMAFKRLTPLNENITVYRGISSPHPVFKKDKQLFEKTINVKSGDTIAMREYAYCTPEKRYAEHYSRQTDNNERIII